MITIEEKVNAMGVLLKLSPEYNVVVELIKKLEKYLKRYNNLYLEKEEIEFIRKFPSYATCNAHNLYDVLEYFNINVENPFSLNLDSSFWDSKIQFYDRKYKKFYFLDKTEKKNSKELDELSGDIKEVLESILEHFSRVKKYSSRVSKLFNSINDISEIKEQSPKIYKVLEEYGLF